MKQAAYTSLSADRYTDPPQSSPPYKREVGKPQGSAALASITSTSARLTSITFDAAINGDLRLLQPHFTTTSQVRSLLLFLFLLLCHFLFFALSSSFLCHPSSPFFLPLRNTGTYQCVMCRYTGTDQNVPCR
ncbi:hypothetical protein BHE74_00053184 [Ensete ventricosum]|nr:hypothetical protein BHE74_00053184 [Ensete ventricosum]RZR78334.1 hypothetical protein BHM03_00003618 [Ensete ventricosum]